jgi:hypothetical protein
MAMGSTNSFHARIGLRVLQKLRRPQDEIGYKNYREFLSLPAFSVVLYFIMQKTATPVKQPEHYTGY